MLYSNIKNMKINSQPVVWRQRGKIDNLLADGSKESLSISVLPSVKWGR